MAELVEFGSSDMPDFEWSNQVNNGVDPRIKIRPNGLVLPKYAVANDFPKLAKCKTKRKTLPHIFGGISDRTVVSQRWRDLVEELEPGIHAFHEVELLDFKEEPFKGGPYYYFFCMRYVDAIILRLSSIIISERSRKSNGEDVPYTTNFLKFERDKETGHNEMNVTISSQRTSGLHLWRPAYQLSAYHMLFLSDQLAASMRKHKINNVRYFSVKEVNEDWDPKENLPRELFDQHTSGTWGVLSHPNVDEDFDEPLRWLSTSG